MARKHKAKAWKAALALGCGAAVGYLVYRNREVLRTFVEELAAPTGGEDYEGEVIRFEPEMEQAAPAEKETDIVIDRTAEDEPIEQC